MRLEDKAVGLLSENVERIDGWGLSFVAEFSNLINTVDELLYPI
jgi:hypothetical protein